MPERLETRAWPKTYLCHALGLVECVIGQSSEGPGRTQHNLGKEHKAYTLYKAGKAALQKTIDLRCMLI